MKIQYLQFNEYNGRKGKDKPKKKHPFLIFILICAILGGLFFGFLSYRYGFNRVIDKGMTVLSNVFSPVSSYLSLKIDNIKGVTDIYYGIKKNDSSTYLFVNNNIRENVSINAIAKTNDVKQIIKTDSFERVINYPDGYYINLPLNLDYDFSLSENYIKASNTDMSLTLSIEESPYYNVFDYINRYENRFFLNEDYQKANNININKNTKEKINGKDCLIISLTRNTDSTENNFNTYTYLYMKLHGRQYLRILIKSNEYNEKIYNDILSSFIQIEKQYTSKNCVSLYPIENPKWSDFTKQQYLTYKSAKDIDWGIFSSNITTDGINKDIPELEKKLEYNFDVILVYNHLGTPVDLEAMKKITEQNKVIEFTLQTCAANNTKLFDYTPMFDIIDGKSDDKIITLAKELKSINTTILFRLNNEMNSDWTSYSGVVNICDPEIYIKVWQRIYTIFENEGVNNCIWVYNPNDKSYPPCKWNNFLAYYPGNEYVQLLGITGYNTGTYYFKENGEVWREFDEIYSDISSKYEQYFNGFPWMITEFASSSVGGNKSTWITNMFTNIKKYSNIKIAIWFNSADYAEDKSVSRPYWINETPETLEAFKKGLKSH